MTLLPGWGSIEATRSIRDSCQLMAMALFFVVVGLQIASYCYSHRHDFLASTGELQPQAALNSSEPLHAAENAASRNEFLLLAGPAPPPPAQPTAAPRHLSDGQKSTLQIALSPFAGQPISFSSVMGDADAEHYRTDFVDIIGRARWVFNPSTDITTAIMDPEPIGVQVAVNQGDMEAGTPPGAVTTLVQTLDSLGITSGHTVFLSSEIPPGGIRLIIGVPHSTGG